MVLVECLTCSSPLHHPDVVLLLEFLMALYMTTWANAMTAEVLVSFLLRSLPLILEQASCTDLLYNDSRQLERGKRLIFCGER